MKRDMELIRALMLSIESKNNIFSFTNLDFEDVNVTGYTDSAIDYHLILLIEASLIVGKFSPQAGQDRRMIDIERLHWEGHEFLDNARNESVWKDTMKQVKEKGEGISIALLTQLLISVTKQHFGLS